jgi:hypothetical protein
LITHRHLSGILYQNKRLSGILTGPSGMFKMLATKVFAGLQIPEDPQSSPVNPKSV